MEKTGKIKKGLNALIYFTQKYIHIQKDFFPLYINFKWVSHSDILAVEGSPGHEQ